jgi:pyruvate dehydrogenase E2 component (dihydrolipoamide acetyltransferase)
MTGMGGAELLSLKRERHPHPSITDLLIKAAAMSLARHPEINASHAGEAIRRDAKIDLGVAVGMEDGPITPVIRDCVGKTLEAITSEAQGLIERARQRRLQPQECTGATFSVSNLGMFDVDNFSPCSSRRRPRRSPWVPSGRCRSSLGAASGSAGGCG